MDWIGAGQLIVGLLGAVGGTSGIVMALTWRAQQKKYLAQAKKTDSEGEKTDAEAAEIVARASAGMLVPMEETIASLRRQLAAANTQAEELQQKLATANKRIGELEDSVETLTNRLDAVSRATGMGPPHDAHRPR